MDNLPQPILPPRRIALLPIRFFVLGLMVLALLWLAYEIYLPHTSYRGEKSIEIPKGYGSRMIGGLLREHGIIESKWAFVTYATFKFQASNLKPGVYVFSEESTIAEVLSNLVRGEQYPNERFLVIPEGWNVRDIGFYLERSGIAEASEFWEVAGFPAADYMVATDLPHPKDFSTEFSFLKDKPSRIGLEGFLFPDTYRVYRDAGVQEIAKKMLANFDRRFNARFRKSALDQGKSIFDIVTVASLIEKEVVSDEDRRTVSGILWRRLTLGIPLQVDATLAYIKGHNDTPLTNADKGTNSRFNTYRYPGLPLGPISNPGLSAIEAALNPSPSSYLYYLSASDGKTIFSKTLEEHNTAKARYLR